MSPSGWTTYQRGCGEIEFETSNKSASRSRQEPGSRYGGIRFDSAHCVALNSGPCVTVSQEDGARIPSIKDVANVGAVAILKNSSVTTVGDPGYFKVEVCSSKPGVALLPPDPGIPTAATCVPGKDPGRPGDRVVVSTTPTPSNTPTPTATPDCGDIFFQNLYISGDDIRGNVKNNNDATAYIITTAFQWEDLSSSMHVDWFRYGGSQYYSGG